MAVTKYLWLVPNWFVTHQQIKIWHDINYRHNNAFIIDWYDNYKKRKAQKTKMKEELLPFTWHLSRCGIGMFLLMKKQKQKNYGDNYRPFLCLMTRYKRIFCLKEMKIKMSLELFHKVPAVGTLFDEQNQPLLKELT